MKICLVIESYPPNISGGVSVYGQRLAHGLANAGHEVFVITTCPFNGLSSTKPLEAMDGNVRVLRVPPLNIYDAFQNQNVPFYIKPIYHAINLWNPAQYVVFRNILRNEQPDVVHLHDIYGISLSFLDAAKSLKIPLILTLHSYGLLCRKVTLLNSRGMICEKPNKLCSIYCQAAKRIIDSKPDIVLSPSQFVIDYHSKMGFFPKSKKLKLINGIEINNSQPAKHAKIGGRFDILFVGRLGRHKGVHTLISAVREMSGKDVHLHIIGKGDYREELERLAENDERIEFHGVVPDDKLRDFYAMADVTVVPSIWLEVAPVVIQESFFAGTPVIGSRIGGIPEMVHHKFNGLLFDPGNTEELSLLLQSLISNRDDLMRMSRNAYDSLKSYSMQDHVNRMLQFYELAQNQNISNWSNIKIYNFSLK